MYDEQILRSALPSAQLAVGVQAFCLTIKIGLVVVLNTPSATLPRIDLPNPRLAWLAMTMRSHGL
jgi:hypothetical protein